MASFLQVISTEIDDMAACLTRMQEVVSDALVATPAPGGITGGAMIALQDLDRLTQTAAALGQLLREVEPDPDEGSWRPALAGLSLVSLRDRLMAALAG